MGQSTTGIQQMVSVRIFLSKQYIKNHSIGLKISLLIPECTHYVIKKAANWELKQIDAFVVSNFTLIEIYCT
jgi:hypothetical protein